MNAPYKYLTDAFAHIQTGLQHTRYSFTLSKNNAWGQRRLPKFLTQHKAVAGLCLTSLPKKREKPNIKESCVVN